MPLPSILDGGANSPARLGWLKRRLKPVTLAVLSSAGNNNPFTAQILLRNLSSLLNVQVAVAVVGADGVAFRPNQYPVNPGTVQLTPINNGPEQVKAYMRPVFQDPTLSGTDNKNHPLPQDIPFAWEGSTESDEIEIDVVIPGSAFGGITVGPTGKPARLMVTAYVEYNGAWQDLKTAQLLLSQVDLQGWSNPGAILANGG